MGKYDSLIDEEVGAKPAPTTPQEANYGALIDEELSSAPLHNSLFSTAGTNPDEEAKKRKLAKELNTPAAILPNDAEQQVQLKKLDADVIKTTAPASAKFLTNEDNAKVTGLNGVDKLVEMERAYKTYNPANIKKYIENYTSTGKPAAEAVQRLSEMKKQGVDLTKELDPYARSTADYFKDPVKSAAGGANIMAAGFVELGRIAPNPVSALMSALSPEYAKERRSAYDTIQQQLNDNVEYWQGRKSPAMQKLVEDFGKAGVADSVMMLVANPSLAVDQLSQSTPYMLPGAGAARGGAGAMATFNAFIEAADAANTARQEAIKNGQSLEQQDRSAMIAAVTTAPLAFLGNKLTGTAAFEADFFTKGSTGQKLLDAVVKEAISGAIEEGSNQLGVNIGAAQYDDNRQILEGVGKAMAVGGLLESTHAVGMTTAERALRTFIKDTENVTNLVAESNKNAAQAVAAHDTIEQLSAMTADNDLRTRAPEAFQEFIETMTEGEELQEVYVDGATALEAIKDNYTDLIRTQPELFARIQEAAGLGHDVQLTVGEYLTNFAGNPIEKTVLPMLKSEPGGATYQEAQEFYNKQAELFQSEVQAVAAQNEPVLSREEFEVMNAPAQTEMTDIGMGQKRYTTPDGAQVTVMEGATAAPRENSITGFEVPENNRGKGVGTKLLRTVLANYDKATVSAAVSSEPSLKAFYKEGFRPLAKTDATFEEALAMMQADSSVTVVFPGVDTKASKQTYEEYVAQHNNKREVYAKDVETVEATIFNEMQKAGRFTSSVNRAYVAPLVEFYKTQAKNFGVMPSEMYAKYPLKVQAFLGLLPSGNELNQTEPATIDDFRKGNVANLLSKGNWVIMTPENPKAVRTPELNPGFVKKFEEQLKAEGIEYYPVDGKYGYEEKSFILFNTTPEQGLALGRQYDQESVLTRDGLIYQDGSRNPSLGKVTEHSKAPDDFYTTVVFPDGAQNLFTVEVDFDTKLQPGEVRPLTPEMVGSLSQLNKPQYNPALRRGEVLPPTAEELALREQVVSLSQAEGVEWSKAFEASMSSAEANLDEKVRQIFDAIPATKGNILRTMVQAGIGAGGAFDMETSAEWSEYRKARAKTQEAERRAQAMYFERIGPPENESMPRDREQIKTQAFKEWFGASKVVASDGLPLIAYHGTGADITRFNTLLNETKVLANPNWTGQLGSWFAAPSDWNDYEEGNAEATADVFANDTGAIYPVYLSIKNPMEYEGYEDLQDDIGDSNPIALKARLKAEGYDGIVVRGSDTDGGQIRDDWVAFEPTQIKSAIGNIGTFDPANPSIVNQGAAKVGQVSIRGVHFSKEQRTTLNGGYYGTGIKGAEADRLRQAKDGRIKQRLYFYVDEGKGVFPEYGVGNFKHVVDLPNMYDGARNPLKLPTRNADGERDMNVFESAVIDAGFDGYYIESAFGRQGAAVLLGDATRSVQPVSEASVYQLSPSLVRGLNYATNIPTVPEFEEAVANTDGAEIVDDGLLIDLVRFQKPEQEAAQSVRTGVFYLPRGSKAARYYRNGNTTASSNSYGGTEKFQGETLLKAPLFVKGATGGKAPEVAYTTIKGKSAFAKLQDDIGTVTYMNGLSRDEKISAIRRVLRDHGADENLAYEIYTNSGRGNQLRYAVQENIIAHAVREAGYDSVVGYSKGKAGLTISEVFDVRELTYPSNVVNPDGHEVFYQTEVGDLTQTRLFKNWFGDSKVVDDEGKPLVVYHGTTKAGFTEFDTDGRGKTSDTGAFFTTSPLVASTYSRTKNDVVLLEDPETGEMYSDSSYGNYPVYLSLQNPLIYDAEGKNWDRLGVETEWFVQTPDGEVVEYFTNQADAEFFRGSSDEPLEVVESINVDTGMTTDDLARQAREDGYDGVIITNVTDEGPYGQGYGWDSTIYVAFSPEQIKSATQNKGTFDPTNPNIMEQVARGSFNLDTLTMTLMQGADLSTVIHESGHFYLEMLEKLANTDGAPQQVQDDYAKTMEWFGLTSAQWAQMTIEQKRPYHEQWAESFERWNLEGQAPTQGLQPIFSRFRAWLLAVYKSVEEFVRLNPGAGKLNDEVRGVFSRLLAAAEAIEATEQARAYQPLFGSAEQAGVSQNAYEDYVNLGKQATQGAIDALQARSMRDMKWLTNARNKALKDLQATAKATRAKVLTEVTEQVTSEPIYQAMRFLRTGETKAPNGDTIKALQGYKLDKAIIAEMFPESALDRPDLTKLRGMTSDQGLDPDVVAKMFGLPSGDALVREIVTAENMRDKIQGLTDQRMLEEHGDLVDEKSLQRAADEAVHNEARAKFMATGLKMLSSSPISVTQMVKAAKQAAENVIANKRVRDVKPKQYTAAESRASKEVLKLAAKNPAQAAEKQRAALLNNRLAAAAQDAVTEVEKALRYLGKFNNEGTRKNLDLDYLEQIDALLEPFDLRKGLSLTTIDARTTLAEWVQNQEAMGFEPTIDPVAMAEARQKSYKNMTMTELRGLVDTIKQIEHMGRMKKKLLTAIEKAEFAERIAEAKASMALNANRVVPEKGTPSDVTGQLGQWVRQMFASHRKFTSFMRELDGGQNNGVLFNLVVRPMAVAGNTETEMKAQAAERLATLFQPIMKTMSTFGNLYARRRLVPGTNISLTHEQRIMFAMNWGNEGNRQRLLDGGITGKKAMSEAEAQAVLDTLTKEEWDFVQGVWDYIAEYRPLIAEQERTLTGKTPEWVEPAEVVTKFGTYKGGYFPAKYDTVLSTRSDALEAVADLRSAMKGAFGSAAARNGYTKARAAQVVGRPLLLNFNAVSRHVNEVIHRLAWQAWLVDAARVSRALDNDFRTYLGAEATKEIQDAIRDIAQGDAPATGPFEVFLNRIRTGTSIVGMGWKITTAMLQPTGLSQSMARVGGRHMAKALARYVARPLDSSDWVNENSVLMRNRGRTMNREMNEILNTVREGKKTSAVTASFFYLVGKLQRTVDVPTFIGAYEKSLEDQRYESAASEAERKRIEATAIAVAEQTVIDTQGGGELKDLAKVQRGSPIYKLFTNFYSYMSTVYNLNVENYRTKNLLSPSELGIFAAEVLLINFVPVVMAVALKNLVKGSCDWDDMECLAQRYASEQISHVFGQMVGLREIGVSVDALTGGEAFGYTGPAGLRFFVDVYKSAEQINQGEADMALFKSVNNTLGALFHYPAGQINATVDGAIAIENGEVEGAAILPALIAGAPK